MFKLFKKKNTEENPDEIPSEEPGSDNTEVTEAKPKEEKVEVTGSPGDIIKLSTEIDKIKASQEAFQEMRKSFSERFTRTSEQIGELRSMILERDRTIQTLELKAVKAADLVASVKPEKLMIELQKQDVKIEALKANIEGNEAIMDRVMEELKEIRRKVEFFRGVEEIVKLSEEIKKELIEIKKIEGTVNIQTDKVQTIYTEMRKKIQDLDNFNSKLEESKVTVEQNSKDIDYIKGKVSGLAEKEELDKIIEKVKEYSDSLKELKKKSVLSRDLEQLKGILEGLG